MKSHNSLDLLIYEIAISFNPKSTNLYFRQSAIDYWERIFNFTSTER